MSIKCIIIICAQALLTQSVFSNCGCNRLAEPLGWAGPALGSNVYGPALAYDGFPGSCGYNGIPNLALGNNVFGSALAYDGFPGPFNGINNLAGNWAYDGIYPGFGGLEFTPTSSGGLSVISGSALPPTGLNIVSENVFEGILDVAGDLPFVGTTAMDGVLPSYGTGAINHGCGNGVTAMNALSDTSSPASVAAGLNFGAPALGYGLPYAAGYGYNGLVYDTPFDGIEITSTCGGGLPVSSASMLPPSGIILNSETVYEGPLAVGGGLPFVGTIGLEGILPTVGSGAVNHGCGNGINAMASGPAGFATGYEVFGTGYGIAPSAAIAPGFANRWAGRGCGCA